jgi:uncharacterized Fe-S center protein
MHDFFLETDSRIDKCKNAIKKLFKARKKELPRRLEEIFSQLSLITNMRNALSHYQCLATSDGNMIISTKVNFGDDGVDYTISSKDLDDMVTDLDTIYKWINYTFVKEASVQYLSSGQYSSSFLFASQAPFQYKPLQQFQIHQRPR